MQELRDIKPYMQGNDLLYWLFVAFCVVVILALIFWLAAMMVKWVKRKKIDIRKEYIKQLKSINWDNPKESAYAISRYGRLVATDSRSKEIFDQLESMLIKYKYKKIVDSADQETINYYNLFMEVLDG